MNAIIVVGIDGWEEFTLPALQSIRACDHESKLIVVDSGSKNPYPAMDGVINLRFEERRSYAYNINAGVKLAGNCNWYAVLNNDVIAHGRIPFEKLDDGLLYSRQIITENDHVWFGIWIAVFSNRVWESVGEFDPGFEMCGFEDADYAIRAKKLGIDTVHYPFPIEHLWGKTRWGLPGYQAVREDNINYFASKHGFRLGANMKVTHN